MPITSVAGRSVIESGAFVIPPGADGVVSLVGSPITIGPDSKLPANTMHLDSQSQELRFSPMSGTETLFHSTKISLLQGEEWLLQITLAVVDEGARQAYAVTYTVSQV